MATSMDKLQVKENEDILQDISSQFFQMVPIRRFRWRTKSLSNIHIGTEEQKSVLAATVLSPLCMKYAPSLSYRRAFVKYLIQKLEDSDVEMCDEIYEVYTDLLQEVDMEDDTLCHKSYFLPNGEVVSLQESVHIISQGTTGLSTWQAALHLAEWAFEDEQLFANKNVLELGSGLGFTGISICKQCCIKSFTFSDFHPQVMFLLMKNIEINFLNKQFSLECSPKICENFKNDSKDRKMLKRIKRQLSVNKDTVTDESCEIMQISYSSVVSSDGCEEDGEEMEDLHTHSDFFSPSNLHWTSSENPNFYSMRKNETINLMKFDWDHCGEKALYGVNPDVIIAADVVYDKSIIPSLVKVLLFFLSVQRSCPVAYIASTVRNEDTRDFFLVSLGNEGLQYEIMDPPHQKIFYYDDIIPIEILKIWHPGNTT